MSPEERRSEIVALVESGEPSTPPELAVRFGVSEDSIRRDLRMLADRGLVRRVHGGALPRSPAAVPYGERVDQQPAIKRRLAAWVARRLASFRAVCLDGGTTVLEVARLLPTDFTGTAVTVSLPVAAELAVRPGFKVVQLGGLVSGFSQAVTGPDVIEALGQYWFDVCILGVCSLDPQAGLTVPNRDDALVKAAMIKRSASVIAVASRTKLGTAEPFLVAPASAVGMLVTDANPDGALVMALTKAGVEVICISDR